MKEEEGKETEEWKRDGRTQIKGIEGYEKGKKCWNDERNGKERRKRLGKEEKERKEIANWRRDMREEITGKSGHRKGEK